MFKYKPSLRRHRKANHKQTNIGSGIDVPCWDKDQNGKTVPEESSPSEEKMIEISASADGGPRSRVCARETLRSAPHRH